MGSGIALALCSPVCAFLLGIAPNLITVVPIMLGYMLSSTFAAFELTTPATIVGICFAAAMAPIPGRFGLPCGIIAGLLHACMVTTVVILVMSSNVVLSLGMVGALSIVRFRTAVKDASDTAFLFWAVAAGITSGAGFYLLTLLGCLFVGVVCILSVVLFDRISKPYLLVVRLEAGKDPNVVEAVLKQLNLKHTLSSQIQLEFHSAVSCESGLGEKQRKQLSKVKEIPGIISVSLVDCRKG